MLYKGCKAKFDFIRFKTIRAFGDAIRNVIVAMGMVNNEKNQLGRKIRQFIGNARPGNVNMKRNKKSIQVITFTLVAF